MLTAVAHHDWPPTASPPGHDRPVRVTLSVGATLGRLGMGNGGAKLVRALSEAGCEVTTVCMGAPAPATGHTRVVDMHSVMRLVPWTPLRLHSGYALALQNNYFDWRARHLIGKPDVLYAYSDQALWSLRVARSAGICTVLHAANTHIRNLFQALNTECARLGLGQHLVTALMVRKIEREYREATLIRAQSTLVRETLVEAGLSADKIVHIPPSVDLDHFQPHRVEPDAFTVGFVGSFDVRKGLPHLLTAFDRVSRGDMHLALHGGSGSRFMNRLLAPYRVRTDVSFAVGDPRPTYRQSSVCVVPSIEDGFAYVVLEALACGVPVIVTENVGGKDAVVDGENGFIVPIRDSEAIAERIRYLYDNPATLARMRQRAREAAEMYTFEREGRSLHNQFMELVGS